MAPFLLFHHQSRHYLQWVVSGFWSSQIGVLLSDGAGGFQSPVVLSAGTLTSDFAIGEFTGDQHLDILYTRRGCFDHGGSVCSNDGLTLLGGDGTGAFAEVVSWDPGGEGPMGVASGDLDKDGRLDAVVTNFNSDQVLVLVGKEQGGFTSLPLLGTGSGPNGVTLGDVNDDGWFDIVTADWRSSAVSVLLQDPALPADTATPSATPSGTPTATEPAPTPSATPTPTLAAGCPAVPTGTCHGAGRSGVLFKGSTDPAEQRLSWRWRRGTTALAQGDFGDPVTSTSYRLCVYDQAGGTPVFKMGATVTPGGTCGTKPCWKALSDKGWAYKNAGGNGDGIRKVMLKGGDAGKPQIQVHGKGGDLSLPVPVSGTALFDQDPAVIVELHRTDAPVCWSSTFDTTSTKKNDGVQFRAVTP